MAFIVREGAEKELKSPLSRAPLDRAIDTLKLAQMGYGESRRAWNLFAEESPGLARLVVAAVRKDHEEAAAATKAADKMLARGEMATGLLTKQWKGGKAGKVRKPKKITKVAGGGAVTKAAGRGEGRSLEAAVRAELVADLHSPDPSRRTVAWNVLNGIR